MSTGRDTFLALDLGASSGRAVLGTLEGARMRMREVYRFRTPMIESAGHLYWDLEALWGEVRAALRSAFQGTPALRSISVDSWAVDYVPLDEAGEPLRNPYAYRDPRTRGRMAEAARLLGAETLYDRTGIQFLEINTLPQLLADLADEPELVARTATRLLMADYLLFRMSGQAVAERTMASTTQLMDVRTGGWADDLIRALGDDPRRWPRIVEPATVLGPLSPEVLRSAGAAGEPPLVVASCSHDTAAAVAAVPALEDRPWAYVSSGTWSLVGAELGSPILDDGARAAGFTNEAGLDGTIRFLQNRTGMWVLEECLREWSSAGERPAYEALMAEAAAASAPRATLDLDAPEFAHAGDMLGRLGAACRAAGLDVPATRGSMVRLILESLAQSTTRAVATLERLTGTGRQVIHLVGGGARNRLLNQLIANACGRPLVAGPAEATSLGNLLVQARVLGALSGGMSVRAASRASSTLDTYEPDDSASAPGAQPSAHQRQR